MEIRAELANDEDKVAAVIKCAFGQADEAHLVARLRSDHDAIICLVAVVENDLVGHVMFSRMSAPFRALGLAPVSVAPEHQRCGIGTALIIEGLALAKEQGWDAIFVVGDPGYYERFGFRAELAQGFISPYAGPYLMALLLKELPPGTSGRIDYAPAFAVLP
jgi:putative acetyltransferase